MRKYMIIISILLLLLLTLKFNPVTADSFHKVKDEFYIGTSCIYGDNLLYTTGKNIKVVNLNTGRIHIYPIMGKFNFTTITANNKCIISGTINGTPMTLLFDSKGYHKMIGSFVSLGSKGKYIITRTSNGVFYNHIVYRITDNGVKRVFNDDYSVFMTPSFDEKRIITMNYENQIFWKPSDCLRICYPNLIYNIGSGIYLYTKMLYGVWSDNSYLVILGEKDPDTGYITLLNVHDDKFIGTYKLTRDKFIVGPYYNPVSNEVVFTTRSEDGTGKWLYTFFEKGWMIHNFTKEYGLNSFKHISTSPGGIYLSSKSKDGFWYVFSFNPDTNYHLYVNKKYILKSEEEVVYYGVSSSSTTVLITRSNEPHGIFHILVDKNNLNFCEPKIKVTYSPPLINTSLNKETTIQINVNNYGSCDNEVSLYTNIPDGIETKSDYPFDGEKMMTLIGWFPLNPHEEKQITITLIPKKTGNYTIPILLVTKDEEFSLKPIIVTVTNENKSTENNETNETNTNQTKNNPQTYCTYDIGTDIQVGQNTVNVNDTIDVKVIISNNGNCTDNIKIEIPKNYEKLLISPYSYDENNILIKELTLEPNEIKENHIKFTSSETGEYIIPIKIISTNKNETINVKLIFNQPKPEKEQDNNYNSDNNNNKRTLNVAVKTQIIKNELYVGDEIPIQVSVTNNEGYTVPIKIVVKIPNNILITGSYMTDTTGSLVVSSFNLPPGETRSISITISASKSGSYTIPVITKVNDSSIVSNVMFFVHDKNTETTSMNNKTTTTTPQKNKKGICGPVTIILLSLIPLLRRKRNKP